MSEVLVRYGKVPEVARFRAGVNTGLRRTDRVAVQTHRGLLVGELLEEICSLSIGESSRDEAVLRSLTSEEELRLEGQQDEEHQLFEQWQARIQEWNIAVALIDLEQTLDGEKTILYVLNDRGPECTKLALRAAAEGVGPIEVQPVGPDGVMPLESTGGGCGSCQKKH